MAVTPLTLNNGTNPEPAATNTITLREFEGAPIPQPDAEANFVNLTDRINSLIADLGLLNTVAANASADGATFGNEVNGIPALELTYPAGPKIRGGTEVPIASPPYVGGQTEFINDDGTGFSGLTALSLTLAGGWKEFPADPDPRSFFTNSENGLTLNALENSIQQVYVDGDLKVSGKVIVDQEVEDSSGNPVTGGGPWQSCNENFLSNHHIPLAGTHFTVDIHTALPDASEVCIEVLCNEQNLQYWNVFTNTWELIINVGDNVYGGTRLCIPLGPGNVGSYASTVNNIVIPDIIDPGIIRLYGVGADGTGGHIYAFKAIYWR